MRQTALMDSPKTIAYRWYAEVWSKGRASAIDEMFSRDGIAHGLTDSEGNAIRGPEGFKPLFKNFRNAFPDIKITLEDTVSEADRVAIRCTVQGTHRGEGLGVAATNKIITFTGIAIIKVKDGKIVEAWNNFDFMSMFQQMNTENTHSADS